MALTAPLPTVAAGAGPQMRDSVQQALDMIEVRVPRFDPVADSGKVLKLVGNPAVPTWAADA